MAIVRVTPELIAEWLFKGLDVEIRDARMSLSGNLELSIRGDDVPDCEDANIICHVHQERGCDRWVQVEIKPAQPIRWAEPNIGFGEKPTTPKPGPGYGYTPYGSAPSLPPTNAPNMGTAGVKPSNE